MKWLVLCAAVTAALLPAPASASDEFFALQMRPGDRILNVFSRTISEPSGPTRRIAGYASYSIRSVTGGVIQFGGDYGYYGQISGPNSGALDVRGGAHWTIKGARTLDTSSSGPVFNVWLWGQPPAHLTAGTRWDVKIPTAWECGPPGMQHVRVLSVDAANDRVVLERTGTGYGSPAGRKADVIDGVSTAFGKNEWKGITIVRRGQIESDFLVIHRDVLVPKTASAPARTLVETEQITLGQVPP